MAGVDLPEVQALFEEYADIPLASISDNQRRPLPGANWQGTVHHGLPRDLHAFCDRPGRLSGVPRPHFAGKAARPGDRDRPPLRPAAEDRRQALPRGGRLLQTDDRAPAPGSRGRSSSSSAKSAAARRTSSWGRPTPAVPDRLAGTVRPGDDRGAGLRHARHRLARGIGSRSHRRGSHGLRRGQYRRGGGGGRAGRNGSIGATAARRSRPASTPRGWLKTTWPFIAGWRARPWNRPAAIRTCLRRRRRADRMADGTNGPPCIRPCSGPCPLYNVSPSPSPSRADAIDHHA